jgi:putative inorganic carbon (HCO3(-)) transporter
VTYPAGGGESWPSGRGAAIDRRDLPAYLLCMLGAILALVISGNASLVGFPIGPDHPLEAAAVLLLVLDPRALRQRRVRFQPLFVACAVMVGVAAWSAWSVGTLSTSLGFYQLLDTLIVPYVAVVLGPLIFSTPARRDLLLRVLVVIGLYLGLTAVFEILGPHQLVFPRYILDPQVGLQYGRARGPFVESEADGLAMCFCGFAAAFAATRLPGRWRPLAVLTSLACAAGVLLCLTRSVWVGAGLGVVLVCLADRHLRRRLPVVVAVAAASITVALAEIPRLQTLVTGRAGNQRSLWDRENVNAAALRIVHDRPLSGVGWANYINVSRDWVRQAAGYPITNVDIGVHNVFLSRAAELGLPAAILWTGCLLAGPVRATLRRGVQGDLRGWQLVLLGSLAAWFVASLASPLSYPLPNFLIWLEAGMVLSPVLVAEGQFQPRDAYPYRPAEVRDAVRA